MSSDSGFKPKWPSAERGYTDNAAANSRMFRVLRLLMSLIGISRSIDVEGRFAPMTLCITRSATVLSS